MKLLIVLGLVTLVVAAPPPLPPKVNYPTNDVQILRHDYDVSAPGSYKYEFEQSDGTKVEQQGQLKNEGRENEYLVVKGYYSWVGPDGVKYLITYVADENGFQPEIEEGPGGAVPEAVVHSLLGG